MRLSGTPCISMVSSFVEVENVGKDKTGFNLRAAGMATGLGLLIAGGAVVLYIFIESAWVEVLFNLGTGVVTGLLYSVFAVRNGSDLGIGQAVVGGALCAILPTLLVWALILDTPGGVIVDFRAALLGGIVAPVLGAMGTLVNEIRV